MLEKMLTYKGVHSSVGSRVLGCGPKSRGFESRCSPQSVNFDIKL